MLRPSGADGSIVFSLAGGFRNGVYGTIGAGDECVAAK